MGTELKSGEKFRADVNSEFLEVKTVQQEQAT